MNNNRLLVVDDDQDTCANLSDILAEFGYEVDVAYDGLDALDLLKRKSYRLALLDYKMPGMTGVEVFEKMRQIRRDIAGLLLTSFASNATIAAALDVGLWDVISKPIDVSRLMLLIDVIDSRARRLQDE